MSLVQRLADLTADSQLTEQDSEDFCQKLRQVGNFQVYPKSITAGQKALFFMISRPGSKSLGILSVGDIPKGFQGPVHRVVIEGVMTNLTSCPLTPDNAAALSRLFDFLVPKPLGLAKSFGCGDRLGLATPGHIRALRRLCADKQGTGMSLILAQQSMRENARTGRTPQSVLSDACWGIFQEGWRGGFGADADHLKTTADLDTCVAAGYTFFTVDPGDHVDETADGLPANELREKAGALPWTLLETSLPDVIRQLTKFFRQLMMACCHNNRNVSTGKSSYGSFKDDNGIPPCSDTSEILGISGINPYQWFVLGDMVKPVRQSGIDVSVKYRPDVDNVLSLGNRISFRNSRAYR